MTVHWTALGVGFVIGLVVGYCKKGAGWRIAGFNFPGAGQGRQRYGPSALGVVR